jgi:hypothetical protein
LLKFAKGLYIFETIWYNMKGPCNPAGRQQQTKKEGAGPGDVQDADMRKAR